MPIKCSFCRKRSTLAGPYETHLPSAHANLDIVLASTIQNAPADVLTGKGTYLSDANEPIEHANSANNVNPARDIAGSERDTPNDTLRREPKTAERKDNIYPVGAEQENYPDAGEAIGEVKECKEECRNLCENPWAPFACAQGFEIASWIIESKVSKRGINDYVSNDIGNSTSVGYHSMHTLENLLRHLDPYSRYLQWLEGHLQNSQTTLPLFSLNVLDSVRYLLRQIACRDTLVYAPRRDYDQSG